MNDTKNSDLSRVAKTIQPTSQSPSDDAIGHVLKEMYSSLVQEPLPDKFQQLLKDLSRKGTSQDRSGSAGGTS